MTEPNPTNDNAGQGTEGAPNNNDKSAELPQWAKDELSRARDEAARYRTRLRDAKKEVEAEVRQEVQKDLDELSTQLSDLKGQLTNSTLNELKLDAALAVGVPGEHVKAFASRLQGASAEELQKDAESAAALFNFDKTNANGRATDPSAGLGGNNPKLTPEDAFGAFVSGKLSR